MLLSGFPMRIEGYDMFPLVEKKFIICYPYDMFAVFVTCTLPYSIGVPDKRDFPWICPPSSTGKAEKPAPYIE